MTEPTILTNAVVLTMDAARPWAEAVGFAAGRIVAVGSHAEVTAALPEARVIDAGGRSLLPGFVESHLHLVLGGAELSQLQLGGVYGFDALHKAFADYAAAFPQRPILLAQGASYEILGAPVTRADLDRVLPDRPIAMMSPDHHTVWANTAALTAAGLLHGAKMPHGHEVVMAPDGLASGELREFEAFGPILALGGEAHLQLGIATGAEPSPWPSEAMRAADRDKVAAGLAHCAAHGITSMVNMDGNRYTCELLRDLEAEGRLTARVKVPFHFKPHMDLAELDRASAMAAEYCGEWVSSGFVKMFMDGVVDSRTAFMLQPYPDSDITGAPLFDPARFREICTEIDRRGLHGNQTFNVGSAWTIDDVGFNFAAVNDELEWTDENGVVVAKGTTATVRPVTPGVRQYGVTTLVNGCRTNNNDGTNFININTSLAYAGEDYMPLASNCGENTLKLNAYDNTITSIDNYNKGAWKTNLYVVPNISAGDTNYKGTGVTGVWSVISSSSTSCGSSV